MYEASLSMQLQPVVKLCDIGMRIRQFRQDAGLSQENWLN